MLPGGGPGVEGAARRTRGGAEMIKGVPMPETNKGDDEIIEDLNNRIAKLSMYGVRQVKVTEPSYLLSWSNGIESWYVASGYGVLQPGQVVDVDANEFLAPYRSEVLNRVVPKLDFLPLYKMSFEAKIRGKHNVD